MAQTRLLFRGKTRALMSHTLKQLARIQAHDAKEAAQQTATGKVANPIQLSPAVKAAVTLIVGTLTAELQARG